MVRSTAKHFCHNPTRLVAGSLRSLTILNPSLCLDAQNKVVYRPSEDRNTRDVAIISGGGSGHEPSFGAFVGRGLLTASVSGSVFASPNSNQVLAAMHRLAESCSGVLVTVMNYTGDVLNFGVAIETFKAQRPDVPVRMLVVGDDVAVPRSKFGKVGRRGMAGTVFVHKVTGALADLGYSLDLVADIGQLVSTNLVTIGVALDRVHVPGVSGGEYLPNSLDQDEVELGMGIHNEAGCARVQPPEAELSALVKTALRLLLDTHDQERAFIPKWTKSVVLLVNNLGGLSALELGAIVVEITDQLEVRGVIPERTYSGTFMSSLDCRGFSVTLLNVMPLGIANDLYSLLDHQSEALGWTPNVMFNQRRPVDTNHTDYPPEETSLLKARILEDNLVCDMDLVRSSLRAGLERVISSEPEVTKYDSIVGDGDCGTTLKRGAEGILALLLTDPPTNIVSLFSLVSASVQDQMDGTSGAIYSIFINALQQCVQSRAHEHTSADARFWSQVLSKALIVLKSYTAARKEDRTLMDALIPFVETLTETQSVSAAAQAAVKGAESTRGMSARLGRTVYVGNEDQWVGVIPDPGAWGLSILFLGISEYLS